MKRLEKLKAAVSQGMDSAASLLKTAILSRRPSPASAATERTLVVMGNGPSLRDAIDSHSALLRRHSLLSVNFAPLTPDFFALRPDIHLLADGIFFAEPKQGNVAEMWSALAGADWPMLLYIPASHRGCPEIAALPANIGVRYFNLTPASGWKWLVHALFRRGLAMPRPRNVLVPAIMTGIREGFRRIVLVGADHGWSKTLWVNDNNRVITVQPHFYEDNEKERQRVEDLYKDIHIHQIYESFAIAFRSYFAVKDYADSRGVEIVNATPGSFIDAFPRVTLEKLASESLS